MKQKEPKNNGYKSFAPDPEFNKSESKEKARQRIGAALAIEIGEMRNAGITDIMLGLKVYAALIDARYEIELLKKRLIFESHMKQRFPNA
jgi:hypothetical protein